MHWLVSSTQRKYVVEGTAQEAEEVRRAKARWHGAVFRKRPATPEEVAEARK